MNVAFLFDAFGYEDQGNYWSATRKIIFNAGVIQASGRHVRVSVGDLLVWNIENIEPQRLFDLCLSSSSWRKIHRERLEGVFFGGVVFCVIFENLPEYIAENLHHAISDQGYLGAVQVNYEFKPHLLLFRHLMPQMYRVQGKRCRIFISMGEADEKDEHEAEALRSLGFDDVDWEDKGAHRTIFDDFDTESHFRRVAAFRRGVTPHLPGGIDDAYELAMLLEDLSPKLFDSLGAACERLVISETDEDIAQVAVSLRRFMEQLADLLFPAREQKQNGRRLDVAAVKNRLWAFLETLEFEESSNFDVYGAVIDSCWDELNAAVHGSRDKEQIMQTISKLAQFTIGLAKHDPNAFRQPYHAFNSSIIDFLRNSFERTDGEN